MRSRYAFVQFTTREAVAEALKLDKEYMKDKRVKVRAAQPSNSYLRTVLTVPTCRFGPSEEMCRCSSCVRDITLDS